MPPWSLGRAERRPAGRPELPRADDSVDLVVSSYVVHHLPDRHAARAEILRILKPGGKAIIWDVVSPHGEPEAPTGDAATTHGHPAPAHAPAGGNQLSDQGPAAALDVVRMLF